MLITIAMDLNGQVSVWVDLPDGGTVRRRYDHIHARAAPLVTPAISAWSDSMPAEQQPPLQPVAEPVTLPVVPLAASGTSG